MQGNLNKLLLVAALVGGVSTVVAGDMGFGKARKQQTLNVKNAQKESDKLAIQTRCEQTEKSLLKQIQESLAKWSKYEQEQKAKKIKADQSRFAKCKVDVMSYLKWFVRPENRGAQLILAACLIAVVFVKDELDDEQLEIEDAA